MFCNRYSQQRSPGENLACVFVAPTSVCATVTPTGSSADMHLRPRTGQTWILTRYSDSGTKFDASYPGTVWAKPSLMRLGGARNLSPRPLIEIDNNLVENAIRPKAFGKKYWLFFGDANAGERSAVIYKVIESCRRHGVEPYTYRCDVLSRSPSITNWQIIDIIPKPGRPPEKRLC